MQYFLKRVADGVFEEVDEFVYRNRAQVMESQSSDYPRYTNDTVTVLGDEIIVNLCGPLNDLAIFMRALSIPAAKEVVGGFIKEPSEVFIRRGKKTNLYRNGIEYAEIKKAA